MPKDLIPRGSGGRVEGWDEAVAAVLPSDSQGFEVRECRENLIIARANGVKLRTLSKPFSRRP